MKFAGLNWKRIACVAVGGALVGAGYALPQFSWLREVGFGLIGVAAPTPGAKKK